MAGVGTLVLVLGAVLVWGNLTSRLRTLPFVGELTAAAGVILVAFGTDRASVRRRPK